MKKLPTIFIISFLLAFAVLGYGIYSYFQISNWEGNQPLHIGALTRVFYHLGEEIGVLIGYGVSAAIIAIQGIRYFR